VIQEVEMTETVKRLYRSSSERMIGGVCGGLGEYFAVDPTLIRLLFVAAALLGGHGLLVYLILLVLVPPEPVVSTSGQ
jgi:phage shock protein C